MVDETGTLTPSPMLRTGLAQTYQPYGETLSSYGSGASPYGFAGEWTDSQTGLQYLRARYYAPWQGRFMTRDAWAGDMIMPMSFNPWLYGYANPIRYTDPSGNRTCFKPQPGSSNCNTFHDFYLLVQFMSSETGTAARTWSLHDVFAVVDGVATTATAFANLLYHMNASITYSPTVFQRIFGNITFHASSQSASYYCHRYADEPKGVICFKESQDHLSGPLIAHELGHVYNATISNNFSSVQTPYNELAALIKSPQGFSYEEGGVTNKIAEYYSVPEDWYIGGKPVIGLDSAGKPITGKQGDIPITHVVQYLDRKDRRLGQTFTYSTQELVGEEFADMFANWVFDGFNLNKPAGIVRNTWMTNRLQADMTLIFGVPPNPKPPIGCVEY